MHGAENTAEKSFKEMGIRDSLNDDGMTIRLVTHEYDVALYAKRILHCRDGVIMKYEINEKRREVA